MKFLFLLLFASCAVWFQLPIDSSPPWDQNNRYALEIENNCNLTRTSLGLSGCSFEDSQIGDEFFINIPLPWDGDLVFKSAKCGDKTYTGLNKFQIKSLSGTQGCSYTLVRSVKVKGSYLDHTLLGRIFIKVLPKNKYYKNLMFSYEQDSGRKYFNGVGWYQKGYGRPDPDLMFYPRGTKGTFLMYCGKDLVKTLQYDSSPFVVSFENLIDCDYEISVINSNDPYMEFATYLHSSNEYTEDMIVPSVTDNLLEFKDRDKAGKSSTVVSIDVNGTQCDGSRCPLKNESIYTVRAITMGARYFLGVYRPLYGTWSIQK